MNKTFAELCSRASAELHQMHGAVLRQRQHFLAMGLACASSFRGYTRARDRRRRKASFDEFVKMF